MKTVEFRFYEELNDFLPKERRKKSLKYQFHGNPAVKDAIEALGVPHTEIDLIVANNRSVDFSYQLKDNDRIAVYPVFEALDITNATHLRPEPLRQIRFILDVHLGKLARYLRLLGFDTVYQNNLEDKMIITTASHGKRIILTRDLGILKNKSVTHGYWLRATDPEKQIREILKRFDLYNNAKPFTRCLECNTPLKKVAKEDVINKLDPKTKQYYDDFFICPTCQKIYWQGSHFENMNALVAKILQD